MEICSPANACIPMADAPETIEHARLKNHLADERRRRIVFDSAAVAYETDLVREETLRAVIHVKQLFLTTFTLLDAKQVLNK